MKQSHPDIAPGPAPDGPDARCSNPPNQSLAVAAEDYGGYHGHVESAISGLWHWHGGDFSPRDSWSPCINVYRLTRRVEVCVDLAGVQKQTIDVRVEPGRLIIRGLREPPTPECDDEDRLRILSMEIDHGPFCRVVVLPEHVDLAKVQSRYDSGILWVRLPLRDPG